MGPIVSEAQPSLERPSAGSGRTVLSCSGLRKVFQSGDAALTVLSGVEFAVYPGEHLAIVGASGSGKSTLLHLLGGLDQPTEGLVRWMDTDIGGLGVAELGRRRNALLGFVYQFHHLLPEFSALDNVAMPLRIRRIPTADARAQALALLTRVGLAQRAEHLPGQLSGGERQRVALARALVTAPACVLADEPTGNLDRGTARQVFELIEQLRLELGTAFVIVTHDHELASRADRRLTMTEGRLVERCD